MLPIKYDLSSIKFQATNTFEYWIEKMKEEMLWMVSNLTLRISVKFVI